MCEKIKIPSASVYKQKVTILGVHSFALQNGLGHGGTSKNFVLALVGFWGICVVGLAVFLFLCPEEHDALDDYHSSANRRAAKRVGRARDELDSSVKSEAIGETPLGFPSE